MRPLSDARASGNRLAVIVAVGMVLRLALSAISYGTNDVSTWHDFARAIDAQGLPQAYRTIADLNHPPLAGWWSLAAMHLSEWTGASFGFAFRLPAIFADAVACLILAGVWSRIDGSRWAACIAMALSLDAILVGAFHGNTDNVYAMLMLLAVYLLCDRRLPVLAGLALAAAVNVKLIPILLLPSMIVLCRDRRDVIRFLMGLAVGAIPFVVAWALVGPAFYRNALAYKSESNYWGLLCVARLFDKMFDLGAVNTYHAFGRVAVFAFSLLAAVMQIKRQWSGYTLATIVMVGFLVLAPGFGVQYTVAVVPLLLAVEWRAGAVYGAVAGAFALITYAVFRTDWWPLTSDFSSSFRWPSRIAGLVVWLLLCWVLGRLIFKSNRTMVKLPVKIRPATPRDVPRVQEIINSHAELGRMLFKSYGQLYEDLRDYAVAELDGKIVGCVALTIMWADLAELRALAVDDSARGRGIGTRLAEWAVDEARRLQIRRVMALTYEQQFFEKLGFVVVPKESLPLKAWGECAACPKRDGCDEIAMIRELPDVPQISAPPAPPTPRGVRIPVLTVDDD
ncbi:MAG: N-acetyltransferase [Tepidisphaeraceae bacterium]